MHIFHSRIETTLQTVLEKLNILELEVKKLSHSHQPLMVEPKGTHTDEDTNREQVSLLDEEEVRNCSVLLDIATTQMRPVSL